MKKEAYLVDFGLRVRIVCDKSLTDEKMFDLAIEKISERGTIAQILQEGAEDINPDDECPFGTFESDTK